MYFNSVVIMQLMILLSKN